MISTTPLDPMRTKTRLCAVVVVALFAITSMQVTSAQLRSLSSSQVIATPASPAAAPDGMGILFGPTVGFDLSPDALNLGAFLYIYNAIVNMPALRFLAEATYGIGLEDVGNNYDYNTFRVAAMALYLVALANSSLSLMPLAGLAWYRYNFSYSGPFVSGIDVSSSDVALLLGAMVIYNQFWFRLFTGLGGSADLTLSAGMMFGKREAM